MNSVTIQHEWPADEGTMTVSVEVDADREGRMDRGRRRLLVAHPPLAR